jgi:fluoride exporter
MMLKNFLLVAIGGSLGAAMRYGLFLIIKNQPFPYATFIINVTGSFLLGIIMGLSISAEGLSESKKLFLATGICGAFTTFSTFSFENLALLQQGKYNLAFIYITSSVLTGLFAAWLGFKIIYQ